MITRVFLGNHKVGGKGIFCIFFINYNNSQKTTMIISVQDNIKLSKLLCFILFRYGYNQWRILILRGLIKNLNFLRVYIKVFKKIKKINIIIFKNKIKYIW